MVLSKFAVNGLYPQACVRYRGVEIGKVGKIALDEKDPRNVVVRVAVERSVPITHGTFAQIGYQGLTGLAYMELDDDGSDPRPMPSSPENPARIEMRSNLFDNLAESSKALLKQSSELLDRLNSIASAENQDRLERTLANFEQASAQLATGAAGDSGRRAARPGTSWRRESGTGAPFAQQPGGGHQRDRTGRRGLPAGARQHALTLGKAGQHFHGPLRRDHRQHPAQGQRPGGATHA